ncbi:glycosyltransferase [Thalassotalea fonticola]|uniref:Glycosyltransferase n=1 Tax=Thalassotalea fonticola TaxID=3065649 RepID=A0ABZ0GLB8_9GAMM|nr:glycosyltransferase [Colwelliaceae bacterium S1-1]
MESIFYLSIVIILYTFIAYPLLIALIGKIRAVQFIDNSDDDLPEISIVLCIYNSRNLLLKRLENILDTDYPLDKLRLIIVSDGSTDQPEEVIKSYHHLLNIKFIEYAQNRGKSYALNIAFKNVHTDLVAFADVRQSFNSQALTALQAQFANENIGAVSGNLHITGDDENIQSEPGLYWLYEKWIRRSESDADSLIGVTGAIYMARKSLIPKIPDNCLLDDMYIPLTIIKNGYKIKFIDDAIAYDKSSSSITEEFTRKVRTLAGNFQLIHQLPWLLNPFKNPVFFQFISHKILRLVIPYALISLLLTSMLSQHIGGKIILFIQLIFYSYSLLALVLTKKNINLPLGSICVSFCSLNYAAFLAGWKYYFTSTQNLWRKH